MKQIKKNQIFVWCCELSQNTGEGQLAMHWIHDIQKKVKSKIILRTPNLYNSNFKINELHKSDKINKKQINLKNYITPIVGIFFCWIYFLKKKKCYYVNYLPLWNTLLFILLPPKTVLGPITGGAAYIKKKKINYFIRRYIFNFLYKISIKIIFLRQPKIIFSTELLKNIIPNKKKKDCYFNYILKSLKDYEVKKKNIDILIYNRNHHNKNFEQTKIIKYLINNNVKIAAVGDILNIKQVKNYGYINNRKINSLLNKSKFTINSGENFYTLFLIEALSNKVKILVTKKYTKLINRNNSKILKHLSKNQIFKIVSNYKPDIKAFKKFYKYSYKKTIKDQELKIFFS